MKKSLIAITFGSIFLISQNLYANKQETQELIQPYLADILECQNFSKNLRGKVFKYMIHGCIDLNAEKITEIVEKEKEENSKFFFNNCSGYEIIIQNCPNLDYRFQDYLNKQVRKCEKFKLNQ